MKKLKQIALIFIGIAFITNSSCKKYPDGPLISLHSKEHRIAGNENKTWVVDYYSINGYDSTSYIQSRPYYGKYWFYSKVHGETNHSFGLVTDNGITCGTDGHWKLTNNKKNLNIQQSIGGCISLPQFNTTPYIASDVTWEIRRLTEDDLWLKTTFSGKEYFMKLKH